MAGFTRFQNSTGNIDRRSRDNYRYRCVASLFRLN